MFEEGHVVRYTKYMPGVPEKFLGLYGLSIEKKPNHVVIDLFPFYGSSIRGHTCDGRLKTYTGFYVYNECLVDMTEQ